jgi:hypothetical protein
MVSASFIPLSRKKFTVSSYPRQLPKLNVLKSNNLHAWAVTPKFKNAPTGQGSEINRGENLSPTNSLKNFILSNQWFIIAFT